MKIIILIQILILFNFILQIKFIIIFLIIIINLVSRWIVTSVWLNMNKSRSELAGNFGILDGYNVKTKNLLRPRDI
jgi:hypothetical protein